MAAYEFECRMCNEVFVLFMRIAERIQTRVRCPRCGSEDIEAALLPHFVAGTGKAS
jgi:putative FmdB family regulatory protein